MAKLPTPSLIVSLRGNGKGKRAPEGGGRRKEEGVLHIFGVSTLFPFESRSN